MKAHSEPKKLTQRRRLHDLLAVIVLVLCAVAYTNFLQPTFLVTTLLFFGLPSGYLLWRKPSNLKKALLAAFLLGTVWGFSFDYVAEFNRAWGWSTNTDLTFPIQFFGVVSLDILIWYFLWVFLTILFYEYFSEYDFSKKISPLYKKSLAVGIVVAPLLVFISKFAPQMLQFQYAYLVLGVCTPIPFTYILWRRAKLFPKVMGVVPFFVFLYMAFELSALNAGLWSFPGQYVGSISIFHLSFPIEEFFFWVLISSAVTAAYHEYVVDDGR